MVQLSGKSFHLLANNLPEFNARAEEVECKSVSCNTYNVVDKKLYVNSCELSYYDEGSLNLAPLHKATGTPI